MQATVECPRCLKTCAENTNFCPRCGERLGTETVNIPDASLIFGDKSAPVPDPPKKTRIGRLVLIMVMCIIGITAVIGIFLAIEGRKSSVNDNERRYYNISITFAGINLVILGIVMIARFL